MYTGYSLVQEEMATTLFGGERFMHQQSLLLVQCAFNCVVAFMCVYLWDADGRNVRLLLRREKLVEQAGIGFSYVGAMLLSNMALSYIAYFEQVLAKSSKPIFVLIVSRCAGVRSFTVWKYAVVLSITLSAALFMYKPSSALADLAAGDAPPPPPPTTASQLVVLDPELLWWGRVLVLVSLVLDGITAMQQDRLVESHVAHTAASEAERPSSFSLMFYVNFWASVYLAVSSVISAELFDAIRLVSAHSNLAFFVCAFGTTSCLGQLFVFSTIRHHGALMCSMVTTTRKFSTVLLSVALFAHPLTALQLCGILLLFGALFVDIYIDNFGAEAHRKRRELQTDGTEATFKRIC
jgi:UDP-galactose transporter B1